MLALEFTSSRMTLETPRKQTARTTIGIKMKRNNKKRNTKPKTDWKKNHSVQTTTHKLFMVYGAPSDRMGALVLYFL